jgi:hypothetical protein
MDKQLVVPRNDRCSLPFCPYPFCGAFISECWLLALTLSLCFPLFLSVAAAVIVAGLICFGGGNDEKEEDPFPGLLCEAKKGAKSCFSRVARMKRYLTPWR